MLPCIYRGTELAGKRYAGQQAYKCLLHQCCTLGQTSRAASCESCKDRLTEDDADFAKKWIDPLHVLGPNRTPTPAFRNMLRGRHAFILCGGPSTKDLDLSLLQRRGCWTLAVNNAAGHAKVRPQAMVASDPPLKFSHSVWLDPGIQKWVPIPKYERKPHGGGRGAVRRKTTDGRWVWLRRPDGGIAAACDMPNTWGFSRREVMQPDSSFFTGTDATWGNDADGVIQTGGPKTVCTMLLALRLAYYFGVRRLYLLGVDFRMTEDYGYSFAQNRDISAAASNNAQFAVVNDWLCDMASAGIFSRFGLEIFNCFEYSGLRAFPYVPFQEAVEDVCQGVEAVPDLAGWYEKDATDDS